MEAAEGPHRYTKQELRKIIHVEDEDYFIGRAVFENIGYLLLLVAYKLRVTPNQVTWIWGIMMTVSSLLLVLNDPILNIVAGAGWVVGYSMDYMDGALARATNRRSNRGAFLDLMNHTVNYPLLFICMGIGVWRTGGCPYFDLFPDYWYIFLGIIAGLSCVIIMLMPTLFRRVNPEETVGCSGEIEGGAVGNLNIYHSIMNVNPLAYVNMMFLVLVFAIVNVFVSVMWLYVILFALGYFSAGLMRFAILYRKMPALKV